MPLPVVPILALPLAASYAASSMRCVGRIRWAFFEMQSCLVRSWPLAANASASSRKSTASITTPLPMMLVLPPWKMPEGIERSTYFSPLNSNV